MENLKSISNFNSFFESFPPGTILEVDVDTNKLDYQANNRYIYRLPPIKLFCTSSVCEGIRNFDSTDALHLIVDKQTLNFASYLCRNCKIGIKKYALQTVLSNGTKSFEILKFGEIPNFGSPSPKKLLDLMGKEREYFFKGRRSESQGLGIAALAYYRRVIENQKNNILDELIKTARLLNASKEMIDEFEIAKSETQFSKAIALIKHGIPQALFIDGHNPLLLLHSAMSEGLHAHTDDECLELATSIRVILTELIERIATISKEGLELKSAVARLINKKN